MRTFAQTPSQAGRSRSVSLSARPKSDSRPIHPAARLLGLQRTIGNQAVLRLLKANVNQGVQSSAQSLDSATRGVMERRFNHDFSGVRVHTGAAAQASAAAEGALAYTAGRDLVFGAGQYQPHTVAGRSLIAHELAHVVQQSNPGSGKAAEEGALEREAGNAGIRVGLGGQAHISAASGAPPVQFLKISNGGFGRALEDYTNSHAVENKIVTLLTKSPTFMHLVNDKLDPNYVWYQDPAFSPMDVGPDGRVRSPTAAAGKRAIFITTGGGARFSSFGSAPDYRGYDMISLDLNDIPFLQSIAHEATHAAAFVSGSAPAAQTVSAEVEAGIQDEFKARQSEATILKEIPNPAVKAAVKAAGQPVARGDEWKVERDVAEGAGVTYIEAFFFSRELRDAQTAQKLSDVQTAQMRNEVDDWVSRGLLGSVVLKPSPGYMRIWFDLQTAVHDWQEFNKTHSRANSNFDVEKEKVIQDHAKRFFKGKVSYRPHP